MILSHLPKFEVPESIADAKKIQNALRAQLKSSDDFANLQTVAGVDVGYDNIKNLAHASIVVLTFKNLDVLECVQAFAPTQFPYVPGFLSFREIPAILAAFEKLTHWPDLLMIDGQGIAHPRRMGIAAHLGLLLNRPSIGVAKSCLIGKFEMPGLAKGETKVLMDGNERIGMVLRSRKQVKPLFISPGHRISIDTAVALVIQCLTRYRLPEPTRLADKFSKIKNVDSPNKSQNIAMNEASHGTST